MDPKVRVMVVDDSVVVRRLLTEILAADPDIEVMATAPNASVALQRLKAGLPDVVTLDVEMPDVSGLELLEQIRVLAPKLPVIMFSSLTQRAATTTLDALARGATDYVTKPNSTGSREASIAHVREQLVPKIKTLGRKVLKLASGLPTMSQVPPRPASVLRDARSLDPVQLVAIGSSTGGPNALHDIFVKLPKNLPVPLVLVQHMPPLFTRLLAERLTAVSGLPVREAKDGEVLKPGHALIAPGDFHLKVMRENGVLVARLDQGPQENSCRPAVDVLFRSVAQSCGRHALGVVLTGMGQDGLRGGEAMRAQGSRLIVQDEASSVVWGMPGYVARAGLAEAVLPLSELGNEISTRVMAGARSPATASVEVAHASH